MNKKTLHCSTLKLMADPIIQYEVGNEYIYDDDIFPRGGIITILKDEKILITLDLQSLWEKFDVDYKKFRSALTYPHSLSESIDINYRYFRSTLKAPYLISDFHHFCVGSMILDDLETHATGLLLLYNHETASICYLDTGIVVIDMDEYTQFTIFDYSSGQKHELDFKPGQIIGLEFVEPPEDTNINWDWRYEDENIRQSGFIQEGHLAWYSNNLDCDYDLVKDILTIKKSERPKCVTAPFEWDIPSLEGKYTMNHIFTQPEPWFNELFQRNNLSRVSYLNDRLNAILLIYKAGLLYKDDAKLIDHSKFTEYMLMTEDQLAKEIVAHNIFIEKDTTGKNSVNRLDVIRVLLGI